MRKNIVQQRRFREIVSVRLVDFEVVCWCLYVTDLSCFVMPLKEKARK